ncbi:MAG: hypothetical protein IKU83_02565, partial [Lachnospiraceae bacterium]|nr:hypothetical protein [Lachnospiraceae bacterium]
TASFFLLFHTILVYYLTPSGKTMQALFFIPVKLKQAHYTAPAGNTLYLEFTLYQRLFGGFLILKQVIADLQQLYLNRSFDL